MHWPWVLLGFPQPFRSANRQYLEPLPIHRVDLADKTNLKLRNRIVGLVEEKA